MRYNLTIKKGGRLSSNSWEYDEEKEEGSYVDTDVTDDFMACLWGGCRVDEDVTLRDLALLLRNAKDDVLNAVFSDWITEFLDEIIKSKATLPDYVKSMELYWNMVQDDDQEHAVRFPECHIMGVPISKKEYFGGGTESEEIVERPAYGMLGTDVEKYADAKISLLYETDFYDSDMPGEAKLQMSSKVGYTLGHILKGVFWELSFHGSPKQTKEFAKYVKEKAESVSVAMKQSMEEGLK